MSGIVGIVNLDGAPVDRQLLQRMTKFMVYRGPDAQNTWVAGSVGFGQTLLRTTCDILPEQQGWTLDGEVWITADARVDGRAELARKLQSKGRDVSEESADVELILHAYHAWAEECVEYLIGDFAFAVWDGRRRRLFAARDHFGVKQFYYAHVGSCLVFSNTLNCLRLHPAVSDRLNDLAIGDFLLFDSNQDPATTTFSDIQRLPPAHCLTWSEGAPSRTRYWTLPVDEPIRYRRASDYVAHFRDLFRTAVQDRLRTNRVAIWMSGGLDSTAVAATAREQLSKQTKCFDLRAYTVVYDRLIPDRERHYSGLVAEGLGIPIDYLVADEYTLYERWDRLELRRPEPSHSPLSALNVDLFRRIVPHSRVVLSGQGGDPALLPSSWYLLHLCKRLRFGRMMADVGRCILSGRLPRFGLRTIAKRWLGKRPRQAPFPRWFNEDFAIRLDLPARWEQMNNQPRPIHPHRPEAYQKLTSPFWPWLFEAYDAGVTLFPIEVRHPFFDLRLIRYLMAVPSLPWCMDKELLRVAMRGTLPEAVRLRPKVPLAGDPVVESHRDHPFPSVDGFDRHQS